MISKAPLSYYDLDTTQFITSIPIALCEELPMKLRKSEMLHLAILINFYNNERC
jgi:hypothetical protein